MLPKIKTLFDLNLHPVPCIKYKKNNFDPDILTKDYNEGDFSNDSNVAINIEKSDLIDLDADTDEGIEVVKDFFGSYQAAAIARQPIDESLPEEITHYFFKSNEDLSKCNLDRKDLNGDKIIELRFKGITIVEPSQTFHKKSKKLYKRSWKNFLNQQGQFNAPYINNLYEKFNEACFTAFLLPLIKSTNTGMVFLDGCLKRYTYWDDNKREEFISRLYRLKYPKDWNVHRDLKNSKIKRVIKANNNPGTKTAGYKKLAEHFGITPVEMKERLNWIGMVPDDSDGKQGKKTVVDFYENALNISEILKTDFPPVNWVVQDILPEGFGLLAGRPKAMKSWTALDLVYKVQNGLVFLDKNTVPGDCLYLALEDNERRLKDRITKLGYDKKQFQHPTILTEAPYLNQGLEESIQLWTEQVANPKLVVIDTLAKVKKTYGRNNNTAYDKDSEMLRDIQKIAMKLNITIMAISHLGKNNFDYDWDRIQGSTGMQGISDYFWMLDRGDNGDTAFIKGRGRDMEDFEFGLTWDPNQWRYAFEGTLVNVLMSNSKKEIIEAMQQMGVDEVQPNQVSSHLGYTKTKDKQRVQKTMSRMRDKFELDYGNSGIGFYSLPKDLKPKNNIDFSKDKVS